MCASDLASESSQEQMETLPSAFSLKSFLEVLRVEDQSIADKITDSC